MFPLFSFVLLGAVVGAFVAVTYYLRPSRGQHGNPDGAAVTVASLCEGYMPVGMVSTFPPLPTRRSTYGLLCGYDDLATIVIDDFDPELPDGLAFVRPYMPDVEHVELSPAPFAPTERFRPVSIDSPAALSCAA